VQKRFCPLAATELIYYMYRAADGGICLEELLIIELLID
jgi:hypothetical protein